MRRLYLSTKRERSSLLFYVYKVDDSKIRISRRAFFQAKTASKRSLCSSIIQLFFSRDFHDLFRPLPLSSLLAKTLRVNKIEKSLTELSLKN